MTNWMSNNTCPFVYNTNNNLYTLEKLTGYLGHKVWRDIYNIHIHKCLERKRARYLPECPEIYRTSVLQLLKYTASLKQMQYRFAVTFGTLSIFIIVLSSGGSAVKCCDLVKWWKHLFITTLESNLTFFLRQMLNVVGATT